MLPRYYVLKNRMKTQNIYIFYFILGELNPDQRSARGQNHGYSHRHCQHHAGAVSKTHTCLSHGRYVVGRLWQQV